MKQNHGPGPSGAALNRTDDIACTERGGGSGPRSAAAWASRSVVKDDAFISIISGMRHRATPVQVAGPAKAGTAPNIRSEPKERRSFVRAPMIPSAPLFRVRLPIGGAHKKGPASKTKGSLNVTVDPLRGRRQPDFPCQRSMAGTRGFASYPFG